MNTRKNIKRNNNRRMISSTQSCLTRNTAAISTIQGLVDAKTIYDLIVTDIDSKMLIVESTTKGITQDKHASRSIVQQNATIIADRAMGYANMIGDNDLFTTMHNNITGISTASNTDCISRCKKISDNANTIILNLVDWNVTAAMITSLNTSITAFESQVTKQSAMSESISVALAQVDQLIKDAKQLLKRTIDKGVRSLTASFPTFSAEYKEARKTLDLGHRHTQFKGAAVNKSTNQEIMNVDIRFISADGTFEIKTDQNGKYRERLNPEVYNITVTHPDFEPYTIDGVKIQPGEIKVENFEMIPKA